MTTDILNFALRQTDQLDSSGKFILIALAAGCYDDGSVCMSIKQIRAVTLQDPKTIIIQLQKLRCAGFIAETGHFGGQKKNVPIRRIVLKKK